MLDYQKLMTQLDQASQDLCAKFVQGKDLVQGIWSLALQDHELSNKIKKKKWPFLLPEWNGFLGDAVDIPVVDLPYGILSVDGSQIYYDKHQGPACCLINIGGVLLRYGLSQSSVELFSYPTVIVNHGDDSQLQRVEMQREINELKTTVRLSSCYQEKQHQEHFICLFDGTLIFSLSDNEKIEADCGVQAYLKELEKMYDNQVLHAGYISYPRSKELIGICKVVASMHDENNKEIFAVFDGLTDMDVASLYLKPGQRSTLFRSKSPVSYLYSQQLKPYFCFINVGFEVVRLEFPYWIAQDITHIDIICGIALDQVKKGLGYPVSLFEAHEQAVVKGQDREVFYMMAQKMMQRYGGSYHSSYKSKKKMVVPV